MQEFRSPQLIGYGFSPERARWARDNKKLLTLRVETSLKCNLACNYCGHFRRAKNEITYERIISVIDQASKLGAESIIIIGGGEPTIYPNFKDLILHIRSHNMVPVIFTNTVTMSEGLAHFLYENNVSVIGKLDSLKVEVQDRIAGKKGTSQQIQMGIKNLMNAGFTRTEDPFKLRLGLSFVISKENIDELPALWRFCRERGIFPNLEMMVPDRRAANLINLIPTKEEWESAKLQLLKIDQDEFGFDWLPYTPLLGSGCLQTFYSLFLTVEGYIWPCAGIQIEEFNIDEYTLEEVINLPLFELTRHIDLHLKGKCNSCKYINKCVGCRGMAFNLARLRGESILDAVCAEDPTCFRR